MWDTKSKKYIFNFPIIFLSFFVGILWHKYQLPPIGFIRDISNKMNITFIKEREMKKVKKWNEAKLTFTKYRKGVPVFLDRSYSDEIGNKNLENLMLIQIPRHYTNKIKITSDLPITIYRMVSNKEINLKHKYIMTDIQVKVIGHSLTHTNIVKKEFGPGNIILSSGGPTASCPIFISTDSYLNFDKKIRFIK